jgi:hypothetical protein
MSKKKADTVRLSPEDIEECDRFVREMRAHYSSGETMQIMLPNRCCRRSAQSARGRYKLYSSLNSPNAS